MFSIRADSVSDELKVHRLFHLGRQLAFICMLIAAGWFIVNRVEPFIALDKIIFHDTWAQWAVFHIFNIHVYAGEIPGWDYFTNSGQPLWPSVEIAGYSLDPVPLLVWAVCKGAGLGTLTAYQSVCVLWLFIFAAGGSVLSCRLTNDPLVGLATFLLLFQGPIWFALPGQVGGFLISFRYLPWLILCATRFIQKPGSLNTLLLAFIALIGSSGYKTGYLFVAAVAFLIPFLATLIAYGWRPQARHFALGGLVSIAAISGILPAALAAHEVFQNNVLVAREIVPTGSEFNTHELLAGLIIGRDPLNQWHGSTTIGISTFLLAITAILAALFTLMRRLAHRKLVRRRYVKLMRADAQVIPLMAGLVGGATVCAILACDLLGVLSFLRGSTDNAVPWLGLRNWGFMITPMILSLVVLAAGGVGVLSGVHAQPQIIGLLLLVIAVIFAFWLFAGLDGLPNLLGSIFVKGMDCQHGPDFCESARAIRRDLGQRWVVMAALPFIVAVVALTVPANLTERLKFMLGPRYRQVMTAAAFLTATVCHLLQPEFVTPGWTVDREILKRQPLLESPENNIRPNRIDEFDLINHFPFYFIGPFIWGESVGFIRPDISQYPQVTNKMWLLGVQQTYFFALKRYHALLAAVPPGRKRNILLGIDEDIARAATAECHRSFDEVIHRINEISEEQLQKTVIVEGNPSTLGVCRPSPGGSIGTVQTNIVGQEMQILIDAASSGFVLISESFAPQWRAKLNGDEQTIYPAQGYAMAVAVPAGRSELSLRYEVRTYRAAYAFRFFIFFTIIAMLVGVGLFRLKR